MTEKKRLFEYDVKNNICFIVLKSWCNGIDLEDETAYGPIVKRPVTLCDKPNNVYTLPENIAQPDDDSLNVWDVFDKQVINIVMDDLLTWYYQAIPLEEAEAEIDEHGKLKLPEAQQIPIEQRNIHKFDEGPQNSIDKLKTMCDELECCKGLADDKKLQNIMLRHDCDNISWSILKSIGFSCDCINDAVHADEKTMDQIRQGFMNFIRHKRKDAFQELDQLEEETKNNGGTAEDLEDIDTIKQMFRDIPQDTDLSQYNNLQELLTFWPSLLLPSPIDGLCHAKIENCTCHDEHTHDCCSAEMRHMCKCVDALEQENIQELTELIEIAEQQSKTKEQIRLDVRKDTETRNAVVPDQVINIVADQIYNDNVYLLNHMKDRLAQLEK